MSQLGPAYRPGVSAVNSAAGERFGSALDVAIAVLESLLAGLGPGPGGAPYVQTCRTRLSPRSVAYARGAVPVGSGGPFDSLVSSVEPGTSQNLALRFSAGRYALTTWGVEILRRQEARLGLGLPVDDAVCCLAARLGNLGWGCPSSQPPPWRPRRRGAPRWPQTLGRFVVADLEARDAASDGHDREGQADEVRRGRAVFVLGVKRAIAAEDKPCEREDAGGGAGQLVVVAGEPGGALRHGRSVPPHARAGHMPRALE